ncbi:STE3-domain-containing protein [Metschnikowia bicuspidata]|uniref:STE3-domain-containing protein n=1 Tax=Metschnikowia bicuspidata TaxID=27322 RepID=A0A4P9ZH86_9ASCO|nr:STE3-domain-containing protein [Metschnikowia bicuspidata]
MAYQIDATGVALAAFSLLAFLLLIPPLLYHWIQKNIPAISLILWFSYKNLIGFINLITWSGDNIEEVSQMRGYCDVSVRLSSAADLGQLCATACLIFNLYMVLSARSYKFLNVDSRSKKFVNVLMCWFNPIAVMVASVWAQAHVYAIVRYRGCTPVYNFGFQTILLTSVWNALWVLVAAVFAILTMFEYLRKRRDFKDLLRCTNSGLNINKFMRLIIFSVLIIFILSPMVLFGFVTDLANARAPAYMAVGINNPFWKVVVYFDSSPMVIVQRMLEIMLSFCAFMLFGVGSEALKMYRRIFIRLGVIKPVPRAYSDSDFVGFGKMTPSNRSFDDRSVSEKLPVLHYIVSKRDLGFADLSPTLTMESASEKDVELDIKGLVDMDSRLKGLLHAPHL